MNYITYLNGKEETMSEIFVLVPHHITENSSPVTDFRMCDQLFFFEHCVKVHFDCHQGNRLFSHTSFSYLPDWRHRRGLQRAKETAGAGKQLQVCVGRAARGVPILIQHLGLRRQGLMSPLATISAALVTINSCGDEQ